MNNLNLVTVESRILGPKRLRNVVFDVLGSSNMRVPAFLSRSFAAATYSADRYERPSS